MLQSIGWIAAHRFLFADLGLHCWAGQPFLLQTGAHRDPCGCTARSSFFMEPRSHHLRYPKAAIRGESYVGIGEASARCRCDRFLSASTSRGCQR